MGNFCEKFLQANRLIEEIAATNKNITPISQTDYPLFQQFFSCQNHTYGNSWSYITQGMYGIGRNKLGYKYYDGENLSAVCIYPKIEQPKINIFYWIRPMGKTILQKIVDFSRHLLIKRNLPTYVKKIFKEQFNYLKIKGFKDISKFPWHTSAPAEDDTYPEIIINVKETLSNKSRTRELKNSFKRFNGLNKIITVSLAKSAQDLTEAWKMVNKFFKQKITSLTSNISTKYDYYNIIFSPPLRNYTLFLIKTNNSDIKATCGFFNVARQTAKFFSSYAALMLRKKYKNLNDFSIIYTCKYIFQRGGEYLNVGGSETEGLHVFKRKFAVENENKMYFASLF
jgi:hypothetical protein